MVSDRIGHFNRGHADALTDLAGLVRTALPVFQTEKQLKAALAEQEALAREMTHRVKNLFSILEGMVLLTARRARTKEELAEALFRAHPGPVYGARPGPPQLQRRRPGGSKRNPNLCSTPFLTRTSRLWAPRATSRNPGFYSAGRLSAWATTP